MVAQSFCMRIRVSSNLIVSNLFWFTPVRLKARIAPFHGEDMGSIPIRVRQKKRLVELVDTSDLKSGSVIGVTVQVC